MPTARVVRSRGRQIIVLPKGISLTTAKVDVQRKGGEIVVREKHRGLGRIYDLIREMPKDVFDALLEKDDPRRRDDVLDEAIFLGAPASLPTMRSFGGR